MLSGGVLPAVLAPKKRLYHIIVHAQSNSSLAGALRSQRKIRKLGTNASVSKQLGWNYGYTLAAYPSPEITVPTPLLKAQLTIWLS